MNKEYLEAFKTIKIKCHPNSNPSPLVDSALEVVEQALQRLESIDNAKPSEALEDLEQLAEMADKCWVSCDVHKWKTTIKQALLKAQEQEKVLGCPLEVRLQVDCDAIVYDEDGYEYNVDYVYKNNFICHNGQCDDFGCDYEFTFNWNDYKNTWWLKKDKSE